MIILPRSYLQIKCNCNKKSPQYFLQKQEKLIKFIYNHKRPGIAKASLSSKNEIGGNTVADFKVYCRAIAIKQNSVGIKIYI